MCYGNGLGLGLGLGLGWANAGFANAGWGYAGIAHAGWGKSIFSFFVLLRYYFFWSTNCFCILSL